MVIVVIFSIYFNCQGHGGGFKAAKIVQKDILKENIIQKLVDDIYAEGYVGKDKEDFDSVLYMNL